MNKYTKMVISVFEDMIANAVYQVKRYMFVIYSIAKLCLPFICIAIGQSLNGNIKFSLWYVYVAIIMIAMDVIHRISNKEGFGDEVPIPAKRFTTVSEDGEASIESNRLQEMILYVSNVEDYLESRRLM
jgi:hypothetical protein